MPPASTTLTVETFTLQYDSPEAPHSAKVFPVPHCPHAITTAGNHQPSGKGVREEMKEQR